jgi:hypothetical protein
MMAYQTQSLIWRAMGYYVFSETFVHIGTAALLISRAYAPSGVSLWPTDAASFAAGQSVGLRQERVLVARLDMQDILLKRANYALQLLKE